MFLHYLGENELSNSTCSTTGTGFMSTKLLLFSIPTLHFLLKSSSFVSVSDIIVVVVAAAAVAVVLILNVGL